MADGIDIIGDVHGEADKLVGLLRKLGYHESRSAWRHQTRTALFLGDLIDRGTKQLETVKIVRGMVDAGSARCIMGNHEWNAIAFATRNHADSDWLRTRNGARGRKNLTQHSAFIEAVGLDSPLHRELVSWFSSLPLWVDEPGYRAIHACWDERHLVHLHPLVDGFNAPTERLIHEGSAGTSNCISLETGRSPASPVFAAMETVLKGIEVSLPYGHHFTDADGQERNSARLRWWLSRAKSLQEVALVNPALLSVLPNLDLPDTLLPPMIADKPTFFGHYWFNEVPVLITQHLACLDYSAARKGPLAAYRWQGEGELGDSQFVTFY